jgi:predicted aminopeptidase
MRGLRNKKQIRRGIVVLGLALVLGTLCGCRTLSFYSQAAKGQYELIAHAQKTQKLVANPRTPPKLKKQLELLSNLLAFAQSDLKLPADGHYHKYVELNRRYVVWDVEAAPEFSLQPKSWWYPLVGSLEYRGYFSDRGAKKYGAWLERKGYDVFVAGVEAYSTLGWFKDPALSSFIFNPAPDLAELIFHELGHAELFARGDENFNEAFATTVGETGARRWLRAQGDQAAYASYEAELARTRQFVHLIAVARTRLEALYGDELTPEGRVKTAKIKPAMPEAQLREEKRKIFERLQTDYAALKASWGGNTEYDGWFARHLNNAQLNSVAAYYDFVPGFERLLEQNHGDLPEFYKAAGRLAKLPRLERHRMLMELGRPTEAASK